MLVNDLKKYSGNYSEDSFNHSEPNRHGARGEGGDKSGMFSDIPEVGVQSRLTLHDGYSRGPGPIAFSDFC